MTMLETALNYQARGWPVFPLAPMSKVPPKDFHGRKDATLDLDLINLWFGSADAWPEYNIGIDTDGAGLVVVDIDTLDGHKNDDPTDLFGYDAWECLLMAAGTSDDRTYTVATPSGGLHLYWQANPALTVKQASGVLAPGIDVRAANSSIVAAGSKTKEGNYACVRDITPRPVPSWLRAALGRAGLTKTPFEQKHKQQRPSSQIVNGTNYAKAALQGELANITNAPSGAANSTLNSAAFKLKRFVEAGELQGEATAEALYLAAIARGQKHHEAVATIKSGLGV